LAAILRKGREDGLKEGVEKGKKAMAIDTAKRMLKNNIDPNIISQCACLTPEEIKELT
jgi:predicted transposase/invertase (TIGR01784 family)